MKFTINAIKPCGTEVTEGIYSLTEMIVTAIKLKREGFKVQIIKLRKL